MSLFLLLSALAASKMDRRADPFQFNTCVWDLQGVDKGSETVSSDISTITSSMSSTMSTCDMFVLFGVHSQEFIQNISSGLADKHFPGFVPYNSDSDVTIFSRVNATVSQKITQTAEYPIPDSKCKEQGQAGQTSLEKSQIIEVDFHEPTRHTKVISAIFSDASCVEREAQATIICDQLKSTPSNVDVILAGHFGAESSDPYYEILRKCWLVSPKKIFKNAKPYTTADGKAIDFVMGNLNAGNSFDIVKYYHSARDSKLSNKVSYPFQLFMRQKLTPAWKRFEITFVILALTTSIGFFTWLLFYSKLEKATEYEAIQ